MDEEYFKRLGLSIARGVPQMATGFVDLAALPFTMTGLLDDKDVVGSTAYLTEMGLLPPPQEGVLNETAELVSGAMSPGGALKAGLLGLGTIAGVKGAKGVNQVADDVAEVLLDLSYRGTHTAPDASVYGATIDSLQGIMPADVYSPKGKRLYGLYDPQVDNEWFTAVIKAKGNPEAKIDVYRAVPKGVKNINEGDWVTTSKRYAEMHGENTLDGDYEIIKQTVPAKTLHSEGAPYEFGYRTVKDIEEQY